VLELEIIYMKNISDERVDFLSGITYGRIVERYRRICCTLNDAYFTVRRQRAFFNLE